MFCSYSDLEVVWHDSGFIKQMPALARPATGRQKSDRVLLLCRVQYPNYHCVALMYPGRGKVLTYDTIADCVKKCEYAVRGEIYLAATERIKAGKEVIFTNVGNPHGLGQKPLTYLRQVC